MKGKTKRFMSLILSLVLALSMALPASATGEAIPSIAASATEASVMEAPVDEAPVAEPTAEPVPAVTPVAEETHPAKDRKVSDSEDANEGNYTIKYYLEGLNGDYAENSEAEKACTGTVGASASVQDGDKKTFAGFTFDESNGNNVLSGAVTEDGGLVLKLYYTRNSYSVTYKYDGTTPASASALPAGGTYKYGAEVSVAGAAAADGYTFGGWISANATIAGGKFTMPAANVEITGVLVRDFDSDADGGKYKFSVANYEGTYDAAKHSVSISGLIAGEDYVSFSTDGGTTWTSPTVWNGTIPDSLMYSEVKWNQAINAGYYYMNSGSQVGAAAYSVQVKATNGTAANTKTGTVTIRPVSLIISIRGVTFQYDGEPHGISEVEGYPESCYYLATGTSLVAGQKLSITGTLAKYTPGAGVAIREKYTDAGTYYGIPTGTISIVDQSNKSTLLNYLLAVSAGSMVINGGSLVVKNKLVSTGDDPITAGSVLKYEVSVENVSANAVENIKITSPAMAFSVPEGVTGVTVAEGNQTANIASIAPGVKITLNAQYTVTDQDLIDYKGKGSDGNNKLLRNEAHYYIGTDKVGVARDSGVDLPDPAPHLTVTVTDTGKSDDYKYLRGEQITYDVTVTNDGNAAVKLETITGMLPGSSITYVPGGMCILSKYADGWSITFDPVRTLNPGESLTVNGAYYVTAADAAAGKVVNTVTATGKDSDNNAVPVQDGSTEDAAEEKKPHLTVTLKDKGKSDDYKYLRGEQITYDVTVTNDGNVTVKLESITDTLPGAKFYYVPGTDFQQNDAIGQVTFNVARTLNPGDTLTLYAVYNVTEADVKAGKVVNTATAGAKDLDNNAVPVQDGSTEDAAEEDKPHLTVTLKDKGKSDDYRYKPGERINYDITVKNDGNVAVNLESVTDMLPGAYITNVPGSDFYTDNFTDGSTVTFISARTLLPGNSLVIEADYNVTEADVKAGKVVNTATAGAKDLDNNAVPVQDGTTEDATVAYNPHMTVTVTDTGKGDGYVYKQGEIIDYEITVTNDGNITINLDSVTGAEISTVSGTDFEAVGDTVTFDPARTLKSGDTLTITAKHEVSGADMLIGKVAKTITAAGRDSVGTPVEAIAGTEDATELEIPHLTLTKTTTNKGAGENGAFKLGEKINYEIKAVNDGTHTVSVEKLEDMLPGVVIASVSGSDCKIDGGLITFDPVRNLKPGETITVTADYTVTEADILAGKVVNTAAVSGKDAASGIVEAGGSVEDKTENVKPSFEVAKAVINTPGRGYFAAGETVEFSVSVKNDGNMTQTGVTVKEEMTGAKFTEILENNDGLRISMDDETTIIESIAPGQQVTLRAEYTVTQANLGQKLTNVVSVTGDETERFECAAEIPVDGAVVMTLVKQWDDQDNKLETRPESVAFILKKTVGEETVEIGKLIASEQNGWTAQSDKLPAHTEDNAEITYTLEEEAVKGYTGSYKVDSMGDTEKSLDENTETWRYTFTNTLNEHTLTIRYLFEDGTVAHKEYKATLAVGEEFEVKSPIIQGYDCDITLISDKMPDDDLNYTVIYRALNKPVDLGAMIVPLGIGNVSPNAGDCFD